MPLGRGRCGALMLPAADRVCGTGMCSTYLTQGAAASTLKICTWVGNGLQGPLRPEPEKCHMAAQPCSSAAQCSACAACRRLCGLRRQGHERGRRGGAQRAHEAVWRRAVPQVRSMLPPAHCRHLLHRTAASDPSPECQMALLPRSRATHKAFAARLSCSLRRCPSAAVGAMVEAVAGGRRAARAMHCCQHTAPLWPGNITSVPAAPPPAGP
jgi:hypothetical protein